MKRGATWCMHWPDWPPPDRTAWDRAFQDGDWLDEAGPGAHLRPKTREKYAESYGHWLAWLADEGLLDIGRTPAERLTQDRLTAYVTWMRGRVAPVTAHIRIEDLGLALNLIDPLYDRQMVKAALDRMPKTAVRDKRRQMRDPIDLIQLGQSLMDQAEAGDFGPPRYNAVAYRDGLIISLLAWRPLRRRNLAALRITDHLHDRNGTLHIVIPGDETKAGNAIDLTWPEALLPALRRYISHWRPALLGRHPDPGTLWISRHGHTPLSAHTLACNIRRHTEAAFGVAISPHRFRDAAATMMAVRAPDKVRTIAAVLGHRSYNTTQKYYNLARQLDAADQLHAGIEELLASQETSHD